MNTIAADIEKPPKGRWRGHRGFLRLGGQTDAEEEK
jgi:hypothetical protein